MLQGSRIQVPPNSRQSKFYRLHITKESKRSNSFQYVKNQLEKVPDRFTPIWKWRTVEEGKSCNGLEEGEDGPREMSKLKLAKRECPHHLCGTDIDKRMQPRISSSQSRDPLPYQRDSSA